MHTEKDGEKAAAFAVFFILFIFRKSAGNLKSSVL